MYFYDRGNMQVHHQVGGGLRYVASGEKMMMMLLELPPGAVVPMHSHPHEQAGFIVEGEMEFTISGEKRRLQKGDFFFVPGGTPHTGTSGPKGAVVLDVFAPPREEYK